MRLDAVRYYDPDGRGVVDASVRYNASSIVLTEGVVLIHHHGGDRVGIPLARVLAVYLGEPSPLPHESVGFASGFVEIPAVRDYEVPALFRRIAAWLRR